MVVPADGIEEAENVALASLGHQSSDVSGGDLGAIGVDHQLVEVHI